MNIDVKVTKQAEPEKVSKKAGEPKVSPTAKHSSKAQPKVAPKTGGGMYKIVAIDAEGNEKGQDFNVTSKTYNKAFSDTSKFKVKKKAI